MKNKLKYAITMLMILGVPGFADMSGDDIVSRSYSVNDGDDMSAEMKMTIINTEGKAKKRDLAFYRKDYGEESRSLIVFNSPPDVKGTSFLTWNSKNRESDQWLYLPALKKIARIGAGEKWKSFMKSHFSNEDLEKRSISKDTFKLIKAERIGDHDCYVVEAIARKSKEKYSRRVYWIRKDNLIIVKSEIYSEGGTLEKRFSVTGLEKINNIWTATSMKMENLKTGGFTRIDLTNIRYNTGLPDRYFRVEGLQN